MQLSRYSLQDSFYPLARVTLVHTRLDVPSHSRPVVKQICFCQSTLSVSVLQTAVDGQTQNTRSVEYPNWELLIRGPAQPQGSEASSKAKTCAAFAHLLLACSECHELFNQEPSHSNYGACLSAAGDMAEFLYSVFADVKMSQSKSSY
jgi:hypothetical protein